MEIFIHFWIRNIPPIFGEKLGATYMEDLVDAADSVEFQDKVDIVLSEWSGMSLPSSSDIERSLICSSQSPYYSGLHAAFYTRKMWSWFPSDYIYD